jgi:hypothetical protein
VFSLFGTILFGLFCFYLQLAVIKGNFKFGLNLLLFKVKRRGPTSFLHQGDCAQLPWLLMHTPVPLPGTVVSSIATFSVPVMRVRPHPTPIPGFMMYMQVHPMRPGATIMSSFLFNIALILLATTATIQFCAVAFAMYADGTEILNIFGNQVRGILGWKEFNIAVPACAQH